MLWYRQIGVRKCYKKYNYKYKKVFKVIFSKPKIIFSKFKGNKLNLIIVLHKHLRILNLKTYIIKYSLILTIK